MGRLFLVEFEETPDARFFTCHLCRTGIAWHRELVNQDHPGLRPLIFSNIVNVVVGDPASNETCNTLAGGHVVSANVYCNLCNMLLGWKVVQVQGNNQALNEGQYVLKLRNLLWWNGTHHTSPQNMPQEG